MAVVEGDALGQARHSGHSRDDLVIADDEFGPVFGGAGEYRVDAGTVE